MYEGEKLFIPSTEEEIKELEFQCVEIEAAPEKVFERLGDDEILELNYRNIKKSLYKIENSFSKFMLKLSKNKYGDLEEVLDAYLDG